jgi:prolipoprotein diacylglyceryltransferase
MELTLLAAALTGAAAVCVAGRLLASKVEVERATDLLLGAAATGLFIGRIVAMIGDGVNPLLRPGDILVVRGGVSTVGASLGAIGVIAWSRRHRLGPGLDQLAPAALAGLAGWHGGCVWRGTCLGTVSDLPWAITSTGTAVTRHPVELYAAAGMLVAALVVATTISLPWMSAGLGLAAAGGVRLATEPLRLSIAGGPVAWYAAAVVLGVAVALAGQIWTRTRPPGPSSMAISPP